MMPDRFDQKLAQILEVSEPESELRPGWEARVTAAISASGLVGKETKPMRRFAYAVAFLLMMGLVATGVFTHSRPTDAKALLISAAEAMEAAKTIHVVGQPNGGGEHPWGVLSPEPYEEWISPVASRHDIRSEDGRLFYSMVTDTAAGEIRICSPPTRWFPNGVVMVYRVGKDCAKEALARERQRFLDGTLMVKESSGEEPVRVLREETTRGRRVQVLEVNYGTTSAGEAVGTVEYDIDLANGHLLGLRQYGPESAGKPLTADMHTVEYDVEVPAGTFALNPPANAVVLAGQFELREGGDYSLTSSWEVPIHYHVKPTAIWHVAASVGGEVSAAVDGSLATAWISPGDQRPGMWFEVRFDVPVSAFEVIVGHAPSHFGKGKGWPRGATVSYTSDGVTWQAAYTGQAEERHPLLGLFDGVKQVKAIRITLTTPSDDPWRISEIELYGSPKK